MRRILIALAASTMIAAGPVSTGPILTGPAAMGDWRADAPGVTRLIRPADVTAPGAFTANGPRVVVRPANAELHVPPGFSVAAYATGFTEPRVIRTAPNGDIFVAESGAGRIRVLRAPDGATTPDQVAVFASGLDRPFGIAFPPGADPRFVYVAENNRVVRFPYTAGDMVARGQAQPIVPRISPTSSHHWTRDVAFSADGRTLYVSVGSASNVAEGMKPNPQAVATLPRGASWGAEADRADVLAFDPEGGGRQVIATGIRNCVTMAIAPVTHALWCATNERDGLGDNTPPDYVTHVQQGGFYGWPWYYLGDHPDPRHPSERPDLAGAAIMPDVLLQAHSAPLGMTFYDSPAPGVFADYRGDAFVALHGSWNRARRTGYKLVRLAMKNGVADGSYQDFLTGFVVDADSVWGRPVGVTAARDGSLLVTDDGSGTVWRISAAGR